jgi:hypothetical protein
MRLLVLLTCLVLSAMASAQVGPPTESPSSNALKKRVEQLESEQWQRDADAQFSRDANCAKADVDGDSYRPAYCQGRCDCIPDLAGGANAVSCDETSAGEFEIELRLTGLTCLVGEFGVCTESPVLEDLPDLGRCNCLETAGPLGGNTLCVGPVIDGVPNPCPFDSPEAIALGLSDSCFPIHCVSNDDGVSSSCEGLCFKPCATEADCSDVRVTAGLSGTNSDAFAPASCTNGRSAAVTINQPDAQECLAQAEASLGQACATLP